MRSLYFLCLFLFLPTAALAASENDAQTFVDGLNQDVLAILNQDGEWTEKEAKLQKIFMSSVDVQWIAKFVMGKHWRRISEEEQARYLKLYPDFSVSTYARRFREYSGETIQVLSSKAAGSNRFAVDAEIKRDGEPSIFLTFHIWEKKGKLTIFDLVVEGVSMLNTQRSEFSSIIKRRGIDGLIEQLEKRAN